MRHDGTISVDVSGSAQVAAYERYVVYLEALSDMGVAGEAKRAHLDTATHIAWEGGEAADLGEVGG